MTAAAPQMPAPEAIEAPADARAKAAAPARSPYIVGRGYDWAFFLLPPLVALAIGVLVSGTPLTEKRFWLEGQKVTWAALLSGTLTHGHLVAVAFRSHGNPDILRRYPLRFLVAPIALFAAMMTSMWVVVCVTVLVVFWDVYHSGLQTFGLGRIYDRNRGNDPAVGRRLDWCLNHLLYAGPIVGGATMLAHFGTLEVFGDVGATFFAAIPAHMKAHHRYLTWAVVGGGTLFLVHYVLAYWRLHRQGYRVSLQKVVLLATTGLCSIYTWGFNSWGQAFLIMNFFHAVQYLGLVWWSEGKRLRQLLRLDGLRAGAPLAVAVFLGSVLAYGYWAQTAPDDDRVLWSIAQTVALMHFWYDGFIWSVRKKQV